MKDFYEKDFLFTVQRLKKACGSLASDMIAKNLVREAIVQNGYDKADVFNYIKSLFEKHLSDYRNKTIDKRGWKKIYNFYINHRNFPKFGTMLSEQLTHIEKESEFELCFCNAATTYGLNPELILLEITIDSLGWIRLVDSLIKQVQEMETGSVETLEVSNDSSEDEPSETETKEDVMVDEVKSKSKRGYRRPIAQYTKDGEWVAQFDSTMEAERQTGIKHSNINACLKGKAKQASGFVWKYVDEVSISEPVEGTTADAPTPSNESSEATIEEAVEKKPGTTIGQLYTIYDSKTNGKVGECNSRKEIMVTYKVGAPTLSKALGNKTYGYNTFWGFVDGKKTRLRVEAKEAA